MVACPICSNPVQERNINSHIDSNCIDHIEDDASAPPSKPVASFFTPSAKRATNLTTTKKEVSTPTAIATPTPLLKHALQEPAVTATNGVKRPLEQEEETKTEHDVPKRPKVNHLAKAAPLAERMRPRTLDDVCGQELVGPNGVIRGLIEQDRVPSMILWGGPGTGKTTIARLIAHTAGCRFVEINSTSSGVNECKRIFLEARNELGLTGRKTILFCDEIHRFSKSQQDVFLGPVEAGQITLIGATTENPSFKVVTALLSRCRTFTLAKLSVDDITTILQRALDAESVPPSDLLSQEFLSYLSSFADGDARTALNLLELAIDLSARPGTTPESLQKSLTQTLVYDRAGDQHYDTISALHKSVRGSDPDASLYYLARMLQSGEDPLYIARRLVVIASEDVGMADNTLLSLATATYAACQTIGMPECRINLAHATVALALAPKSTRAYRGLGAAMKALKEPGIAGLPIPIHLRNAPTRLMKEMGYGKEYKYNPNYVGGRVVQEYFPEQMLGTRFLEDRDLGTEVDPELPLPAPSEEKVEVAGEPAEEEEMLLDGDAGVDAVREASGEQHELPEMQAQRQGGEEDYGEVDDNIWTEEDYLANSCSQ
ncbi:DNA replication ATPase [Aulographum hederae CBS 113979]|uniref:DNA replication ATPase n=1 Tax=Aulographum hederae CBS 113979 TaxID=1176131 RepID=A0A6G1H723_9PEZI|nr:DNA replication ATPase [Aulographum hederae CBS 113979]